MLSLMSAWTNRKHVMCIKISSSCRDVSNSSAKYVQSKKKFSTVIGCRFSVLQKEEYALEKLCTLLKYEGNDTDQCMVRFW